MTFPKTRSYCKWMLAFQRFYSAMSMHVQIHMKNWCVWSTIIDMLKQRDAELPQLLHGIETEVFAYCFAKKFIWHINSHMQIFLSIYLVLSCSKKSMRVHLLIADEVEVESSARLIVQCLRTVILHASQLTLEVYALQNDDVTNEWR